MTKYEKIQEHLKENQSTWLVTGVAGFIGSNLLEKLLILDQKVVGIDNFDTGYEHNIDQAIQDANNATGKDLSGNFKFINGDICNLYNCRQACNGVDYVLHHAALGSVPRSVEDPIKTNDTNINGFLNMLISSKDANVKRFIYAASSSTYGDHPELPKVEERTGNPLSPYAVTKVVNELYAEVFAKIYGLQSIGLRYFNIFGKRQDTNGAYAAVIPKWISSIIHQEDVYINGDGGTSRDFCYIENVIQMNILAATTNSDDAINQVYNVALNERTSLNELHQMIEVRIKHRITNLEKKAPIHREFRIGDVRHSLADISKAQNLLGYSPDYRIEQGLDIAMDWYMLNLK